MSMNRGARLASLSYALRSPFTGAVLRAQIPVKSRVTASDSMRRKKGAMYVWAPALEPGLPGMQMTRSRAPAWAC